MNTFVNYQNKKMRSHRGGGPQRRDGNRGGVSGGATLAHRLDDLEEVATTCLASHADHQLADGIRRAPLPADDAPDIGGSDTDLEDHGLRSLDRRDADLIWRVHQLLNEARKQGGDHVSLGNSFHGNSPSDYVPLAIALPQSQNALLCARTSIREFKNLSRI